MTLVPFSQSTQGKSVLDRLTTLEAQQVIPLTKFGGVSGMTNAAQALKNALAQIGAGTLVVPPGAWNFNTDSTGPLSIPQGVDLDFSGQAGAVTFSGATDIFQITGGVTGTSISGLYGNASGMTAGDIFNLDNCSRVSLSEMIVGSPYNLVRARKINQLWMRQLWINGVRGDHVVKWYGDDANRSDVLDMDACTFSGVASGTATGIIMDGNVNTLRMRGVAMVNGLRGLHVRNTGGGSGLPLFVMSDDFETDFTQLEGIRIECGSVFNFVNAYVQGSRASHGVVALQPATQIKFTHGRVSGHYMAGFNSAGHIEVTASEIFANSQAGNALYSGFENESGGRVTISGGVNGWPSQAYALNNKVGAVYAYVSSVSRMPSNATGTILDSAGTLQSHLFPRGQFGDVNFYLTATTTSANINFDPNDYIAYARNTDTGNIFIGGVSKFNWNTLGVGFNGTVGVAKMTLPAAATDLATAIALANAMRTGLIANGLAQ